MYERYELVLKVKEMHIIYILLKFQSIVEYYMIILTLKQGYVERDKMTQPRRCIEEVSDALIALGCTGSLDKIYDEISNRNIMNFTENPDWNATVRRLLEQNSSDS
ncbi:hypothetical protein [Clostridium sp.]|uniref:hypothetical protein n=1 Tax=Clostridium sp. TaxID=1506 RepID=UPI003D6D1B6F